MAKKQAVKGAHKTEAEANAMAKKAAKKVDSLSQHKEVAATRKGKQQKTTRDFTFLQNAFVKVGDSVASASEPGILLGTISSIENEGDLVTLHSAGVFDGVLLSYPVHELVQWNTPGRLVKGTKPPKDKANAKFEFPTRKSIKKAAKDKDKEVEAGPLEVSVIDLGLEEGLVEKAPENNKLRFEDVPLLGVFRHATLKDGLLTFVKVGNTSAISTLVYPGDTGPFIYLNGLGAKLPQPTKLRFKKTAKVLEYSL